MSQLLTTPVAHRSLVTAADDHTPQDANDIAALIDYIDPATDGDSDAPACVPSAVAVEYGDEVLLFVNLTHNGASCTLTPYWYGDFQQGPHYYPGADIVIAAPGTYEFAIPVITRHLFVKVQEIAGSGSVSVSIGQRRTRP